MTSSAIAFYGMLVLKAGIFGLIVRELIVTRRAIRADKAAAAEREAQRAAIAQIPQAEVREAA